MSKQDLGMTLEMNSGFYGKLPVLGDFVSRRLPNDFILSWDKWLQNSLAVSKEKLADQWMQSYLTSPIWRFALSPGLCGNDAWLGIMMPSVDRVGRYFPLTIACKVPGNYSLINLFTEASVWFYEAETAALSALENDLSVEEFDQLVQGINSISVKNFNVDGDKLNHDGVIFEPVFYRELNKQKLQMEDIYPQLPSSALDINDNGYSLWNTVGSEQVKLGGLVLKGMPVFTFYTELITGDFHQQGWDCSTLVDIAVEEQQKIAQSKQAYKENSNVKLSSEPVGASLSNAILSTPEQRASQPLWRSFSKTDKGNIRRLNEDAILDRPDLGLWVVADGMGGHQAGDLASRKIVHGLNKMSCRGSLEFSLTDVKTAIQTINTELRLIADSHYEQQIIGSTIVALIADKNNFACLWAGDSRLYRLRENKLIQLTIDHCASDEADLDLLGANSTTSLKQNNVITRAVGAFEDLELDCQVIDTQKGDLFLLSSDGLDKELSFNEIEQILVDNIFSDSVEVLLEEVLKRRGRDNISIVVVDILE